MKNISKTLQCKIDYSIKVIQKAQRLALTMNESGFWLAFSGGKDSQVLYHLALLAGVKFKAYMNLTTIDPPEVIRFVRKNYPQVTMIKPTMNIYDLAVKKHIAPTRTLRWCCAEYKETAGAGYVTLVGIRKQESSKRSKRELVETIHKNPNKRKKLNFDQYSDHEESMIQCMGNGKEKVVVSPILYWTERDVWEFLNSNNIEHCSLYDKGYSRIGCICCPMSQYRNKIKELKDYPHVKRNWIKTFEKLKESGYLKYDLEASEMFDWWISGKSYKKWYSDKFLQQKIDFDDGEE
ncbi:phosphoadenosine phosphosulfate reductase family protein [Prevotella disiens]|uniref:phosphoadenosine phosphosulfate reductase family protein n=1 Tax=Prevotella disiens TaxID=28130 RepID=UPI00242F9050|nr:phosphoadenosine phosphosulfate reductase family protein [Prevotella disiens]